MSQEVAQTSSDLLASSVSNAGAQLGINFMRSLSKEVKDNVVISPISIQIILNLILLGAELDSQTERELLEHIGYEKSADKEGPHKGMQQVSELLAKSVSASTGLKFDLANLLLISKQPSSDYIKSVEKFYRNTKMEQVSNKTNAADLIQRINSWVASTTHNHITNIADGLDLTSTEVLMILVNAAYFQGEWLHKFAVDQTAEQPFYNQGLENQPKKVKFMIRSGSYRSLDFSPIALSDSGQHEESLSKAEMEYLALARKLDCRALSLPFSANKGTELDMIILLPNKRDGLASLLSNLTPADLKVIFKELDGEAVAKTRVELPKFSFEAMFDVKSAMQAMGVRKIFSESAELERMFPEVPSSVGQILHKAKISVDEMGAEAAAVTVATVTMRSGGWPARQPFKADRPFLFVIRHKPSGMPTFMGSVVRF